jgi:hypothetical protein
VRPEERLEATMLFSDRHFPLDEHVIIHVHAPRSGGTTLRTQMNDLIGLDACLMNYRAEIEYASDADLNRYHQISGHFSYGMHQYLPRQPLYVTTVRDPVERFISLYSVIRARQSHRLHGVAKQNDINQFLQICLEGRDPELKEQVRNLQCQFICGAADFSLARTYIDERYFIACTADQIASMMPMLSKALRRPLPTMRVKGIVTKTTAQGAEAANYLTNDSIAILLEHNMHDLQIFHYVQREFFRIEQSFMPSPANHQEQHANPEVFPKSDEPSTSAGAALGAPPGASRIEQLMMNAAQRFVQCFPTTLLDHMRCLWIGPRAPENVLRARRPETASDFDEALQKFDDTDQFDLIMVALPFESTMHDTAVFAKLCTRLSATGIMQICCVSEHGFPAWEEEYPGFIPLRRYDSSLLARFQVAARKLLALEIREKFPLYGSRSVGYAFFKKAEDRLLIQTCLTTLRRTLSVTAC